MALYRDFPQGYYSTLFTDLTGGNVALASGKLFIGSSTDNASGALLQVTGGVTVTGLLTQTFTGTTTNACVITADSLTTGKALTISANALTSGNAIYASSTSTGRITASSLLSIASSGANASASIEARGISSTVVNTGITSTNTAIYSSASGATTTNYSFYGGAGTLYNAGNVLIGSTSYSGGSSVAGQLVVGTTTGGSTPRNTITFGLSGFAAPGAWNTDSNGDKIVFWNNNVDADIRMGQGNGEALWLKAQGSSISTLFSIYGNSTNSGTAPNVFSVKANGSLVMGANTLDSTSSLRGVSRSSDGGTWLHGLATGSISAYSNNGTNSVNINRYAYSGFDGFVATNTEFYGVCQDHQYGGPGAQYSIISTGRISFFAGGASLQANGAYQAPLVGSWLATGLSISGSLSKGSGSFRIEHPLPELSDKHDLVHSFIEGPKADLIYRGKVQLEDGKAIVNIDTVSKMTEGTFVLLCRDIDCFVTNNSSWTQVKGSVTGNLLSIVSNDNTSTDIVTWMVIGERQDKHMYDTGWTDDEGHVVVEPLKQD